MADQLGGFRWWAWAGDVAHLRRFRAMGRALCGVSLDRRACYAIGTEPKCEKCIAKVKEDACPPS